MNNFSVIIYNWVHRTEFRKFCYRWIKIIALMSLAVILSACSPFSPIKMPSLMHFTLGKASHAKLAKKPSDKTVLVSATTAAPGFESARMRYVKQNYQLQAFSRNEWVAPPAQMLNHLLVESLQNSNAFKAVVGAPYAGVTDLRVDSQLIRLQQDFVEQQSFVEMVVRIQVINNRNQNVIATKRFTASIPTPSSDPYGGVLAANAATHEIMQRIAMFVVDVQK